MYSLSEFKAKFDPLLEEFLNKKLEDFNLLTSDEFVKEFVAHTKTLILSSGKRLRPYLAYLMYKAYGGKEEKQALELFISLEVFHMFALVHDDIMDRASTRHGVTAMHKFILEKLSKKKGFGDLVHISNSQAILVGDLLMSWALDNFKNETFEKKNFEKAGEYFYKMIDEVILGQMLDVDIATKEIASEELINEKTRLKTSRYTCVRPMQIGASLADRNYGEEKFLDELGTKVGVAFQIQDDLLDIIGDQKVLEKSTLRDIADHQHTFFTNFVFENGTVEQKEKLFNFFGKKLNAYERKEVIKIFTDSGSISIGKKAVIDNLEDAKKIIEKSSLGQDYKDICFDLVKIMEARQN